MRLSFLIFLMTFGYSLLYSQVKQDSLLDNWNNPEFSDTTRLLAYNEYLANLLYSYPDSAFNLADDLIEFAKTNDFPIAESYAYNLKGISVYVVGNYNEALNLFSTSKGILESLNNKDRLPVAYTNMGNALKEMGFNSEALNFYKKSLSLKEELYKEKGLDLYVLAGIAGVYVSIEEHENAMEYYNRVLANITQKEKDAGFYDRTLSHVSQVYVSLEKPDTALAYAQRALDFSYKSDFKSNIEYNLFAVGYAYNALNKFKEAMEYFTKSLEYSEKLQHVRGKVENLNYIGELHLETKAYRNALEVCSEGYRISEENNYLEALSVNCECMYKAYRALGNKTRALETLEELSAIKDSLDDQETSRLLQQMEFRKLVVADSLANAERELKIQEAHEQEVERKNRIRNLLLLASLFILMIAGGIYSRLRYIRKSKAIIEHEKERSESLLLNILPAEVAEELKANGNIKAKDFDRITILFTDFVSFTKISEQLSAAELVDEIHTCFEHFDGLIEKYEIEKVKTIGDAYMAAGGLPVFSPDSAKKAILTALDMQEFIVARKIEREKDGHVAFEMRAGIHTGPVVAGIVGVKKFQYDIWGDTVNTASRMESACEPGKVNISKDTYALVKDDPDLSFGYRGLIEVKGKGEMDMYYVSKKLTS